MNPTSSSLDGRALSALVPASRQRPGNDPIFALNAEARQRSEAGESILNATLGVLLEDDGRLAIMPSVAEAFRNVPPERAAAYAPISGDAPFLAAVIEDAVGAGLAEKAVAVATAGATGAVHHAMVNFLEPGQSALLPGYYWGPYAVIAQHARRSVRTFRMFGDDLRFDLGAFEAGLHESIAEQGRATVMFNFPCNNPTGYALDDREWSAVADMVREAGRRAPIAFLLDHAYAKFEPEGAPDWLRHVPTMLESATVLVAWTASKAYAQYGARVGAIVALHRDPDERRSLANALNYSCRATWSNCNHLGILAVTELLTDPGYRRRTEEERTVLKGLLDDRVAVFNAQARRAGLPYPRYESGFFVTVVTPDGEGTAAAMRDDGVFVVPMRQGVRVALCATPAHAVPRIVESLARGVAAAGGTPSG